ncbi:hypothetical protein FQA39_LY02648 [Lamprigera yunnana]|nr:hypothetical protein FQA39_LY02648 [Lamprigera yunnana]
MSAYLFINLQNFAKIAPHLFAKLIRVNDKFMENNLLLYPSKRPQISGVDDDDEEEEEEEKEEEEEET